MSAVDTIALALGARSYDICVGAGLLEDSGRRIAALSHRPPVIVVTDETVKALHLATVLDSLEQSGVAARSIVLPPGEATKTFAGLEMLTDAILDGAPERRSLLVALGGGVIGDIVGFAASAVLRGIDFVQIPTTLLAQVDSSVGGKTGINTRHGKNLVGAFYQPRLVLADTGVLDTLPRRELLAGYAEVAKYGLIGDPAFFDWLDDHGADVIAGDADARRHAVVTSCRAKAGVVAGDERETGARALLNFGHTFGHALEAETGFGPTLLHGEAVAIGMVMAFDLSARLGLCSAENAARARRHLSAVGLPTGLERLPASATDPARLVRHMHQDKKVRDGKVTFILARGIGEAFIAEDIDLAEVEALLQDAAAAA